MVNAQKSTMRNSRVHLLGFHLTYIAILLSDGRVQTYN